MQLPYYIDHTLVEHYLEFYSEIMTEAADKVWNEQGRDDAKVDELLHTKLRNDKLMLVTIVIIEQIHEFSLYYMVASVFMAKIVYFCEK